MASTSDEEMRVTFPASNGFAAVGRVAAAGLAFRLGFDVGQVENLRLAVEQITTTLAGEGSIDMTGRWNDVSLSLELKNPAVNLPPPSTENLLELLSSLVNHCSIEDQTIHLLINRP